MRKLSIVIAVVIGAACLTPQAAFADKVDLQSKDKVEGACNEKGGVFFPTSRTNSTYGCLNKDGSGIVCGGRKPADKTSCDTWPADARILPTRDAVRAAVAASVKVKRH